MKAVVATIAIAIFTSTSAHSVTLHVYPTGTSSDIQNVRQVMLSAQPGDTVLLHAGEFNWTGNSKAITPLRGPFGLPLTVSSIIITGETTPSGLLLTTIRGPTDPSGFPRIVADTRLGTYANAAFFAAPGAYGMTIRNLIFKNFEVVLGLLQTASSTVANGYVLNGDFTAGAHDVVFSNNVVTNSLSAIESIGGNDNLVAENNTIGLVNKPDLPPTGLIGLMLDQSFQTGIATVLYRFNTTASRVSSGWVVRENTFLNEGLGAMSWPVFLIGTSTATIENNKVDSFPVIGIYYAGDGNSSIKQNDIAGTPYGIFLGNISEDPCDTEFSIPCTGPDAGIPSGNSVDAVVTGNHIRSALDGSAGIVIEGDHNLIQGNDYMVSGLDSADVALVLKGGGNTIVCNSCIVVPVGGGKAEDGGLTADEKLQLLAANTISGAVTNSTPLGRALKTFPPPRR